MSDVKFSQFSSGTNLQNSDIIVGLRSGVNTQFNANAGNSATFAPSGVASGNIFTSFSSLCTYLATLNQDQLFHIYLDSTNTVNSTITIPAGTYTPPANVKFEPLFNSSGLNQLTLSLSADVIFNGLSYLSINTNGGILGLNNTSSSNITLNNNPFTLELINTETSLASSSVKPFVSMANSSAGLFLNCYGLSALSGNGTAVVVNLDSTSSSHSILNFFDNSILTSDGINVNGYNASNIIFPSSDAIIDPAYQHITQQFPGSLFFTLTDASTIGINLSEANNFQVVLGGNRTLAVPSSIGSVGQSGVINVYQDGTGNRTLGYGWMYQFVAGIVPVLSTGAFSLDQLPYIVNSYATSTVTISIATPAVVTWTAHGLISGQRIQLATSGTLPTGLSTNTTYWVTVVTANTFKLSTSFANAQAGTFIATSGTQSGIQTATEGSISLAINPSIA